MTSRAHKCESCGAPASVHVMHEIGRPGSAHHLCMHCADGREPRDDGEERSPNHGTFVVAGGFVLLTFCIVADQLRLGAASNFDLRQTLFVAMAALLIGSGAIARASGVSILGMLCLLGVLGADHLGIDSRQALGISRTVGLIVACLTIGTGVALGYVSRHSGRSTPKMGFARTFRKNG